MTNPFNKNTQEALYLSYEHGINSSSKDDCPYSNEDPDESPLHTAWMRGFRKKGSKKEQKEVDTLDILQISSEATIDVQHLSTDVLMQELKKRKLKELEALRHKKHQLTETLTKITLEISKLELLCG